MRKGNLITVSIGSNDLQAYTLNSHILIRTSLFFPSLSLSQPKSLFLVNESLVERK
jgi:hypothetical protein